MNNADERENPTPVQLRLAPGELDEETLAEWQQVGYQRQEEEDYLWELVGVDNLSDAISLNVIVNTLSTPISHLGAKLPNLQELNLNGSQISSIRDLGTDFSSIRILWISRCTLSDIDGLISLPRLAELYASFNDISDLQPLAACSELEVLDLEANCISSLDELQFLGRCPKLSILTLSGNPLATEAEYRLHVRALIPSVHSLDDGDVETTSTQQVHSVASDEEVALVSDGIKHARVGVDGADFAGMSVASLIAGSAPTTSGQGGMRPSTAALQPAGAATWLRTLRSSHVGPPALDANSGSNPLLSPHSPAKRLSSATAAAPVPGSPGQRASSADASSPRPTTARPTTGSTTDGRLSTGSIAAPSGLYWQKQRIGSADAGTAHENAIQSGSKPGDDGGGSSSQLTYGSDGTFGANLTKDLRRWKRNHVGEPTTSEASPSTSSSQIPPSSSIEHAALLQHLIWWKVETAEKVTNTSDEASPAWPSDLAPTLTPALPSEVLDLSHSPRGPTSDPPGSPSPLAAERALRGARKLVLSKVMRDMGGEGDQAFLTSPSAPAAAFVARKSEAIKPPAVVKQQKVLIPVPDVVLSGRHGSEGEEPGGVKRSCAVQILSVAGEFDLARINPTPVRWDAG